MNDWNLDPDAETLAFHLRQKEPYRSTVAFAEFARPWLQSSKTVIDLGCGAGQPTDWLAQKFPKTQFLGLDASPLLISLAKQLPPDASFGVGDMHNLTPRAADGVISLATLSWMPSFETPLDEICKKINPKWLAFSSLLYPGDISCNIVVDEPQRPRKSYYNVYSVTRIQKFLTVRGYRLAKYQPFNIDVELPKPEDANIMKSYTEHGRIFSGPLTLPWGFVAFERVA